MNVSSRLTQLALFLLCNRTWEPLGPRVTTLGTFKVLPPGIEPVLLKGSFENRGVDFPLPGREANRAPR